MKVSRHFLRNLLKSSSQKDGNLMSSFNKSFIQEMKRELDVDLIGVASVEQSISNELKEKAAALLPGAKSVVVMGKEIYKEVIALVSPSKEVGEAKGGDLLANHSEYLNSCLARAVHELARLFKHDGYRSLPLPAVAPTDQRFLTAIFSFKHAGQLAGLGTIGRHSLLITPEFGPRVRLACLLTEAEVDSAPLAANNFCTACDACIQSCPAHALQIPQEGEICSINRFACRTYRQAGLTCSMCMKACAEVTG
jgi:epoxyqueuosine reductase